MEYLFHQSRVNLISKRPDKSLMCETLDEIHEVQLAAAIARMRKEQRQKVPAVA